MNYGSGVGCRGTPLSYFPVLLSCFIMVPSRQAALAQRLAQDSSHSSK